MNTQRKLLDKDYLTAKILEINNIKYGEIYFDIRESNRILSNSLYVNFYLKANDGKTYKTSTLRISDHLSKKCVHTQFIIEPDEYLTKKKKDKFLRTLSNCIDKAKQKFYFKEINKI